MYPSVKQHSDTRFITHAVNQFKSIITCFYSIDKYFANDEDDISPYLSEYNNFFFIASLFFLIDAYTPLSKLSIQLQDIKYFVWKTPNKIGKIIQDLNDLQSKFNDNNSFYYFNKIQKLKLTNLSYTRRVVGNYAHCSECLYANISEIFDSMAQCHFCLRWFHMQCIDTHTIQLHCTIEQDCIHLVCE